MTPYATRAAALSRILRVRRDLHRAGRGAGQRACGAGDRHHNALCGWVDRAKEHDALAGWHPNPCHPSSRPTLWPHRSSGEAQQLRFAGDEHEIFGTGGKFHRSDQFVTRFQPDDIPLILVSGVIGNHAFHNTRSGPHRQPDRSRLERRQPQDSFALPEGYEFGNRCTAGEAGRSGRCR